MEIARIDLEKTDYCISNIALVIDSKKYLADIKELYYAYCRYKKFASVMPIFDREILDNNIEIIGYFDSDRLAAFTMIKHLDDKNIENIQFAWDYHKPTLRLGVKSLEHECAFYKGKGFKYMYIGNADTYKSKLQGYEIVGPA